MNNKLRFFAAHLGAKVLIDYPSGNFPQYGICSLDFLRKLHDKTDQLCTNWKWNKLILRSMSKITDEDAIEVAKSLANNTDVEGVEYGADNECLTFIVSRSGKMLVFHISDFNTWSTDYLRSKGYCLPFMGLDPVKEGWAIIED